MTFPTRAERAARIASLEARLDHEHPAVRPGVQRQLDVERAALRAVDQLISPGYRSPYVGEGVDGALRSAQIDREEADGLDRTDPRYERCLESAAAWERQAAEIAGSTCPLCTERIEHHAPGQGCPPPL